jgi:hypothetical protein
MKSVSLLFGLMLLFGSAMRTFGGPPPPTDVMVRITAKTAASGLVPDIPGNGNANNWVYQYGNISSKSLVDTLPVEICITRYGSGSWVSFDIQFGNQGQAGNLPGVTYPNNVSFTKSALDGSNKYTLNTANNEMTPVDGNDLVCSTVDIDVNGTGLTVGNSYSKNIQISSINEDPPTGNQKPAVTIDKGNIQIKVSVIEETQNLSCFITDSQGFFLTDCQGNEVNQSGSTDGRFVIVINKKKIEVATNPGQFYYNLLYTNSTNDTITPEIDFTLENVIAHGTQAVHSYVFNPWDGEVSSDNFNVVNNMGIAGGQATAISGITIPVGATLWVTYHLEWSDLNSQLPVGCPTGCVNAGPGVSFSVTATVKTDSNQDEVCQAGAYGYLKK